MKKLNNKGYMLVEIILASVLAFGVAYYIIDLTIKFKNKNDDLLVETEVATDRAIITNKLMKSLISDKEKFDCNELEIKNNKTVTYNGNVIDIINDYATAGDKVCEKTDEKVTIKIPLTVKQMPDNNYDIDIEYKFKIGDMEPPTCTLTVEGTNIKLQEEDNMGIDKYGLVKGTTESYNNIKTVPIDATGNYSGYVKDIAGNKGECHLEVIKTSGTTSHTCKKAFDDCPEGWSWQTNGCFYYVNTNYLDAITGGSCESTCSSLGGVCSGSTCYYCPSGYHYYSTAYCYKDGPYSACNGGTKKSDGCYLYNQTNCTGKYSSIGTTNSYACQESYTKINDNYCYKIK